MPPDDIQQVEQGSSAPGQQAQGDADSKQDERLTAEAAKWRVKARDLEAQLNELKPKAQQYDQLQESQKTEAQKLADRIAALEAELQTKAMAADKATAEAQLIRLATKAG